jgi:hypothetical protein
VGLSLHYDDDEIFVTASSNFFDPRSFILLLNFEIYQMHVVWCELLIKVVKLYLGLAPNKKILHVHHEVYEVFIGYFTITIFREYRLRKVFIRTLITFRLQEISD